MNKPWLSRAAGGALIAGAVIGVVGFFLRTMPQDPGNVSEVLRLYAQNAASFHGHALWTPLGWILILVGVVGVCKEVPAQDRLRWADLAIVFSAIFTTLGFIGPTLDGWMMPALAQDALTGGPASQAVAESMYTLNEAIGARFALVFALGVLLFGLALRETRTHPDWLAWAGAAFGAAGAIVGLVWMVTNLPPAMGSPLGLLFVGVLLSFPWYLVVGWYQLRSETRGNLSRH